MKTKSNGSVKKQNKVHKVPKPAANVKNREQLRKKLKGLLDKQPISSIQSVSQKVPNQTNSFQNKKLNYVLGNESTDTVKPKKQKESLVENVNNTNHIVGSMKNGNKKCLKTISNKRKESVGAKSPKMKEKNKKNTEIKNVSNKSKENKKLASNRFKGTKIDNKSEHLQNSTHKLKHSSSSDTRSKTQKSSKPKKINKEKIKRSTSLKSMTHSSLDEQSLRTEYHQGRGPLRPQTSESELDLDIHEFNEERCSSTESISKSKLKTFNKEQALVRAENDFEDSGSENHHIDNSYFDFLFDKNVDDYEETTSCSTYSQEEYSEEESDFEYSDEEPDFEYESDSFDDESSEDCDSEDDYFDHYASDFGSTDDESYHPPENHLQDVYIAKGTAVKYDITTDDVQFDSDSQGAQIIEMPKDPAEQINFFGEKALPLSSEKNQVPGTTNQDDEKNMDSDDSCPSLVPIDSQTESAGFYTSSSDSSHSCDSSCDCGFSDEVIDFDEPYKPMAPEVIKANAETNTEIETIFNTRSNEVQNITTSDSVIKEITNCSNNVTKYKVITTNNEILDSESILNDSLKRRAGQLQKENDSSNKYSDCVPNKNISDKNSNETVDHAAKKIKIMVPIASSDKDKPSSTLCLEKHEPNKFKDDLNSNSTKKSNNKNSIRTMFFNAVNSNHVIVLLKDPLYIYGTVKLKLLAGSLNIFGYNPKQNEELELFSPRGYSSLKIESSYSKIRIPLNEDELLLLTAFFIRNDLEEIVKNFDTEKDAIVLLERNDRSKKVNMLRKYMVEHLFPNMNSITSDRPFYTSEFLLRCIITPTSENGLLVNPEWNTIPVLNNSKIMLIGGKSVGKSTLVRFLINRSLNKFRKILLIDLDIGQPEMFVPQTISVTTLVAPLLGPGFFLNKQPDKSFLIGHYSIIHSLEPYIEGLKALFEYCNQNSDYKDIPWIVNTMGYNKGFGDELISVICSLLQPSNIVQFESGREINDFDVIMMKDNLKSIETNVIGDLFRPVNEFVPKHQLTLINAYIPSSRILKTEWTMKPKDMRLAMILLRLSNTLIGHSEWMTDVKPICASIDDLHIIKMGDDQMDKEDLVKTLVGNLVYLCRYESGKAHECFGIGIVRGVDYPLRQIYLLPSISHELLKNVNCVAICGTPLPSSILLKQGPKVKGTASYVYNTLDEAASMYIQHMFNKPQQFPMAQRKSHNH